MSLTSTHYVLLLPIEAKAAPIVPGTIKLAQLNGYLAGIQKLLAHVERQIPVNPRTPGYTVDLLDVVEWLRVWGGQVEFSLPDLDPESVIDLYFQNMSLRLSS